jgi:hypothetical protein
VSAMTDTARPAHSLWVFTASPGIWAVHFMLCYATAAVWCAKQPTALASLSTVRFTMAIYTALALAAIAVVGSVGWRAYRSGPIRPRDGDSPHDADTVEDRHRFMGFATVLLSGLSALAVVYAALAAVFIETCQ